MVPITWHFGMDKIKRIVKRLVVFRERRNGGEEMRTE